MLSLYRSGRQRDALRVYQETRLELVEELGLEPGEELRALERMIICARPEPRGHRRASSRAGADRHRRVAVLVVDERRDELRADGSQRL